MVQWQEGGGEAALQNSEGSTPEPPQPWKFDHPTICGIDKRPFFPTVLILSLLWSVCMMSLQIEAWRLRDVAAAHASVSAVSEAVWSDRAVLPPCWIAAPSMRWAQHASVAMLAQGTLTGYVELQALSKRCAQHARIRPASARFTHKERQCEYKVQLATSGSAPSGSPSLASLSLASRSSSRVFSSPRRSPGLHPAR